MLIIFVNNKKKLTINKKTEAKFNHMKQYTLDFLEFKKINSKREIKILICIYGIKLHTLHHLIFRKLNSVEKSYILKFKQ